MTRSLPVLWSHLWLFLVHSRSLTLASCSFLKHSSYVPVPTAGLCPSYSNSPIGLSPVIHVAGTLTFYMFHLKRKSPLLEACPHQFRKLTPYSKPAPPLQMFTPFPDCHFLFHAPIRFFSTVFFSIKYVIYLFVNYLPIQGREYGHLFVRLVSVSTWHTVKWVGLLYLQSEPQEVQRSCLTHYKFFMLMIIYRVHARQGLYPEEIPIAQ